MLCRPIVVVGWILCHRVLVRADALPLWLFVWRMLCRRAPSGGCFAAVVVLMLDGSSLGIFGDVVPLLPVQLLGWPWFGQQGWRCSAAGCLL